LIYGSPVPDYAAPAERTSGPGTAVLALVTRLLDAIARGSERSNQGSVSDAADPGPADGECADGARANAQLAEGELAQRAVGGLLADEFFAETAIDAGLLARGLSAWTLLIGAVSSEVFGQLGEVGDPDALFEWHLSSARRLVLPD
jgi:hypothetical protein